MDPTLEKGIENARRLAAEEQFDEAAEAFREVFERHPENPETLVALADVMSQVGQPETSLALLADSIDESNPNPVTLGRIADQLRDLGRLDESADFLLCALSCSPNEDPVLRGRTEQALKDLGRTAQLEWLASGGEGEIPQV